MSHYAITAIHYGGGKIDLVALHKVVEKQIGTTEISLDQAQRVSVGEVVDLIAAGDEIYVARRTESHTWEIVCDVKASPSGDDIVSVDILDQPNDALQTLPQWS